MASATSGCVQAAYRHPTGAQPVHQIITNKPVINVPGCPPIAEVTTGVLNHLLTFDRLPELDRAGRPKIFYGQRRHDHCYRRAYFVSRTGSYGPPAPVRAMMAAIRAPIVRRGPKQLDPLETTRSVEASRSVTSRIPMVADSASLRPLMRTNKKAGTHPGGKFQLRYHDTKRHQILG